VRAHDRLAAHDAHETARPQFSSSLLRPASKSARLITTATLPSAG
jgi:hypothetical protein